MFIEAKVRGRLSELRALALASKVGYSKPVLAILNNDALFFKVQEHFVLTVFGRRAKYQFSELDTGLDACIQEYWEAFLSADENFEVHFGSGGHQLSALFVNQLKYIFYLYF
jgi:hypothetical protein